MAGRRRLGAAIAAMLLVGCQERAPAAEPQRVRTVFEGCVQAMLRSTCQVVNDKAPIPDADVVMVAGVGRVDARAYRALREAGEGMCAQVQTACTAQWDGAPCRTARALWGGPELKPR